MSTNGHQPGREPLSAEEWLEARHADRDQRSPFARGRASNGAHMAEPPAAPTTPPAVDDDPSSLPIFSGAWSSDEERPGRTRSEFSLRPLVETGPVNETHVDHTEQD
ncbi:hypothetical protein, partial [Nocardioides sp.]|uniref:hypothetical protein n=1 Tax=Nocardioides sp. TaxID=35761 RepID=UPI00273367BD